MEIWKDIPGYPGHQASSLGRIRTVNRYVERTIRGKTYSYPVKGIYKTAHKNNRGYLFVNLSVKNNREQHLVHRVIANTFIPNPKGLETVHHINSNRYDNRVANLLWLSRSDNTKAQFL